MHPPPLLLLLQKTEGQLLLWDAPFCLANHALLNSVRTAPHLIFMLVSVDIEITMMRFYLAPLLVCLGRIVPTADHHLMGSSGLLFVCYLKHQGLEGQLPDARGS